MTVQHLDFKKHFRVVYGLYVEDHDDPNRTNNMSPRTHECIALGTIGNIQGTQKVFFLDSDLFLKTIKIIPTIEIYRIIKIVDNWCKKTIRLQYGNVIEIRNRKINF